MSSKPGKGAYHESDSLPVLHPGHAWQGNHNSLTSLTMADNGV